MQPVIEPASDVFLASPVLREVRHPRLGAGRWVAGVVAAAAVHLLAGLAIAGLSPQPRFEDWPDGADGTEISVSLHAPDGRVRSPVSAAAAASPLDSMLEDLAATEPARAQGNGALDNPGASLSDLFGDAATTPGGGSGQGGARDSAGESGAKAGFDYGAQASVPRRRPGAGEGPVGPCWGRPERPVPVVMAILLDKDGVLVGRPRIIRAGDGPGDPRAADYERTAMRAMAGCAPFSLAPPGVYEAYRIDFSREKGGLIRLGPMAAP